MRFFSRLSLPAFGIRRRQKTNVNKFIFLYHRIASPEYDPFALSVEASQFEDHLEILRSRCEIVALDELLYTDAPRSGALASITFDDGYVDNLTTAAPILQRAGLPATFFICTGYLGDARGFWWDRVATAIIAADPMATGGLELSEGISIDLDLRSRDARNQSALAVAARLQRMPPQRRDKTVEELERQLPPVTDGARESCPVLDEAGVRELGSQPLAQIGAHTHGHPMLSVLTREEQLTEIDRGAAILREITGIRPHFLAYPYGSEEDYNADSYVAARAAGFDAGFVNHWAPFDTALYRYRIPRFYVAPLPADEFRSWLQGVINL